MESSGREVMERRRKRSDGKEEEYDGKEEEEKDGKEEQEK
jgi:hypothetical protein